MSISMIIGEFDQNFKKELELKVIENLKNNNSKKILDSCFFLCCRACMISHSLFSISSSHPRTLNFTRIRGLLPSVIPFNAGTHIPEPKVNVSKITFVTETILNWIRSVRTLIVYFTGLPGLFSKILLVHGTPPRYKISETSILKLQNWP